MTRRRAAIVTAGIAAGAVAGGMVGRTLLNARRRRLDPDAHEELSLLPPEDLGPVTSFDGTNLAVRAAGDSSSPILLFVHGFSLDLTTWHYQWTELSERYRCVLFDLRSHGRSVVLVAGIPKGEKARAVDENVSGGHRGCDRYPRDASGPSGSVLRGPQS